MKPFQPLEVARILRAMDELEYAAIMREHAIDLISAGQVGRAIILTEAGSRAWFVMHEEEFTFKIDATPAANMTTVVSYGPTRGLFGDIIYEFSERLRNMMFDKIVEDFVEFLWDKLRRRRR